MFEKTLGLKDVKQLFHAYSVYELQLRTASQNRPLDALHEKEK